MLDVAKHGLGACSLKYMTGLNYRRERPTTSGLSDAEFAAFGAGRLFANMKDRGWNGGSPEMVAGYECNSNNPNQHEGHTYSRHFGHLLRAAVLAVGGVGKVHLSPWSDGVGGSGSMTRFVLWYFPSAMDSKVRIGQLLGMSLDNADPLVVSFVNGIKDYEQQQREW